MTGPRYSPDNPFAQKYSPENPFAQGYSPDNPFVNSASSRAPEPEGNRLTDLPRRYGEAVREIVSHPLDALTGMAKAVLLDALKLTVPIPGAQGRFTRSPLAGVLPELNQEPTLSSVGGAALRTGANVAFPGIARAVGPVAAAAGVGALQSPQDPLLGAALGGTFGAVGKSAAAIGRRAGLKNVAKSGAPLPESKAPTTPEPPPEPLKSAIRDLENRDILDMTPEGIGILAKQAAKEERALYTTLFGPKGARRYREAVRTSTSADASPEAAARALAEMQRMYSELTPGQQTALDEIQARGFTSKRLKKIADLTKDYTPENLAGVVDDAELTRMFGDVLMSNKPDRNLAGLYRLRAVYGELLRRGVSENDVLHGVYEYMLQQGIKPEGLGPLILGKMDDVRKTLNKVVPDKVAPSADVASITAAPISTTASVSSSPAPTRQGLARDLGPISEDQFQSEAAAIAPRPVAPVDETAAAAARVEAARTTPFPTAGGAANDLTNLLPADGSTVDVIKSIKKHKLESAWSELATEWKKQTGEQDYIVVEAAARRVVADYNKYIEEGLTPAQARIRISAETSFMAKDPDIERLAPDAEIQSGISGSPLQEQIAKFIKSETGSVPDIDLKSAAQAARDAGFTESEISRGHYDKPRSLQGYKFHQGDLVRATPELVQQIKAGGNAEIETLKAKLFQTEAIIKGRGEDAYNQQRDQIWGSDSRLTSLDKAKQFVQARIADIVNHSKQWERQLLRAQGQSPGAVEAVKTFAKDESGYLDLEALLDPLKRRPAGKLPQHSENIQNQIEIGYDPNAGNPLSPLGTIYRLITRGELPPEGFRGAFIRRTAPLEALERTVTKAQGKPIPVAQRASAVVQLLSGWAGKAEHFLKFGGFRNINGQIVSSGTKGLQQIFREAGDLNDFRRLAIAERVDELDAAGRKVETGITPADARQEIANATPRAKQAVRDLHAYLDSVLQYAIDSDLIDPTVAAYLRQLGQAYVPLDRVLAKGAQKLSNVQYAALSTAQQFRALIGSKLKIVDPMYTAVDYTRRLIRASELNKAGLAIVEFAKAHPNETKGWITREKNASASATPKIVASGQGIAQIAKQLGINIDLNTAKQIGALLNDDNLLISGDIMRVRQGGEVVQYRVHPGIGNMLRSLSPQQLEGWLRLAAAPSQLLKIGVTANPAFAALQAFVGAFQTKIQSQYGFRITQDPFIGLYNRVRKTPAYREALAAGGTSAYLSAAGRSTESALRSIVPGNIAQKTIRTIAHPLEALRTVADPLEEMNRLGEYIRARKQGAEVGEAALAMREADTDFSMIGTQMAGLAHLVAFANPFIQAGDKALRTLAKSPTAWVSGIVGVTAPSIAFWLAADGDKKVRDLQRSQQGQRNWFLRLPKTGEIVKIPKPYIYGEIFGNTIEAVLDQSERETPEQYATLAQGIRDNFTFLMLPTAAQTYLGLKTGISPLTGSSIVPESRAGLEPALQYTNQTTETARAIGDMLNISPARIDFAVQSLGGTLAQEGMRSLDRLVPDGKATPPAPVSADLPLIGRFFARYPSESVEPIRTFYKNATDAQVKLATARKYVEQMQPEKAKEYVLKNRDLIGLADGYGKVRQEFAEKRGLLEKIRDTPDDILTPQTKRELTDQVLEAMIESARQVNDAVRRAKKSNIGSREVQSVR